MDEVVIETVEINVTGCYDNLASITTTIDIRESILGIIRCTISRCPSTKTKKNYNNNNNNNMGEYSCLIRLNIYTIVLLLRAKREREDSIFLSPTRIAIWYGERRSEYCYIPMLEVDRENNIHKYINSLFVGVSQFILLSCNLE